MKLQNKSTALSLVISVTFAIPAHELRAGQVQSYGLTPGSEHRPVLAEFSRSIASDQYRFVTSPLHAKKRDLQWIVPLSAGIALLAVSDSRDMTERLRGNPASHSESVNVSNAGLLLLASVPAGLYWWGWRHDDNNAREMVMMTARAGIDSLIAAELIGAVTRRERPAYDNAAGHFVKASVWDNSFPSRHATVAWSIAAVVAQRYPGWLTQLGVYGAATAVSLSRISANEHFPSDVLVGSALGFLTGHYVAGHGQHHEKGELLAAPAPAASRRERSAGNSDSGATTVPMDNWVYPALDRLAALGLVPSQISGLRPWTRGECRRQIAEAATLLDSGDSRLDPEARAEALRLVTALQRELPAGESTLPSIVLDSVYVRNGVIAGPALNDGYHFGQTWANDFGRPFGRGWNAEEGFIAHAESGRFFAFVRGEYQHAPGEAAYSEPVRQLIANVDGNPVQEAQTTPDTNRFRSIEAYAGVRLGNFNISAGKQSLYWGPTYDAPLSFSNNAEPTKNLRVSLAQPVRFAGILSHLGDIRAEAVMGKLGGQSYTWRPWFNGVKISFKLTDNLEMGFTRWSILWGVGHPETLGSFVRNLTSTNSPLGSAGILRNDPGDRKAGFDFRYRVPGLRNWVTLYSDAYSDDDPSPLAAPRRAAINPGMYLTHVPGLPKLDFRVEAPMTRPFNGDQGGQFVYYNGSYHSGNTNYGYLLGNPTGRDARAIEAWTRYWFTPRDRFEAGYRQMKVGTNFLPGGGTQSDTMLRQAFDISQSIYADVSLQYERYFIPVLGGPRRNLSATIQFTWHPEATLTR